MIGQRWAAAALILGAVIVGCTRSMAPEDNDELSRVPNVVTSDIQAGIEQHVDEMVEKGRGYFHLDHGEEELRLKLVKVHTEYLSNLGPRSHFACVDLVDVSGDVYDVDFFLEGDPGSMTVTGTTVHKINGQPYYAWEQKPDGSWARIPVEEADHVHFGVKKGHDEFEFLYQVRLPGLSARARMWIPIAESNAFQDVELVSASAPVKGREIREETHGNTVLYLELEPGHAGKAVELRYRVQRREKKAYAAKPPGPGEYLDPEPVPPEEGSFSDIASEAVKGKTQPMVRARALYDHVIDKMFYRKVGEGWGEADAAFACDSAAGNCTDFHSYFIALARSIGIPARFAIGASIPSNRSEGGISGYHCWAEFYAEGKWWPVDISEGDKYSALSTYYFGHHPANRIELSKGRNLLLDPGPRSGPIPYLVYPFLETEGELQKIKPRFSFLRVPPKE
ncbi:MAG: transglutaminase-like domain-containing protein [Planctomycetota bacterium]|jgi:transglutaminase-like putative cysteine protease